VLTVHYSEPFFCLLKIMQPILMNLDPESTYLKNLQLANQINQKYQTAKAIKYDDDKLPMHLLSTIALEEIAAVLQFGAQKYDQHNWRKGFVWSRPLSAALRHILAFNAGEDTDPESGHSHIAHAMCCLMFLLEFEKTHPELDDRYKPDV